MTDVRTIPAIRRPERRGTVLIMVVGVLAMLFIVGATHLIVARFERKTTEQKQAARNIRGIADAVDTPTLVQLRQDIVGHDGIPYNAWGPTGNDQVPAEDYADFAGYIGSGNLATAFRNGDLLISSPEVYPTGTGWQDWRIFALSWGLDALRVNSPVEPPPNHMEVFRPEWQAGHPFLDADADGVPDALSVNTLGTSAMFGGTYLTYGRVVPHGGMVLLDRLTHPALLAQVIHPEDSYHLEDSYEPKVPYSQQPRLLWANWWGLDNRYPDLATTTDDERKLRRRFMLPTNENYTTLASTSPIARLPVTLGYAAPSGAGTTFRTWTPHWWPINGSQVFRGSYSDWDWMRERLTPPAPLSSTAYNPDRDTYDRRRLITTVNSDDLLRPQRQEERLRNQVTGPLYYVLNPTSAAEWDTTTIPGVPIPTRPDNACGTVRVPAQEPYVVPGVFNVPGLRTQFSLRDVLEPVYNAALGGFEGLPSYRRAEQLTAYFLAMIQYTSVPGSAAETPTPAQLLEQLRTAAQLAVNVIDFADAPSDYWNTATGGLGQDGTPDVDLPTFFEWPQGPGATPAVRVVGVERQPYITEAYVRFVVEPDNSVPPKWRKQGADAAISAESVWAVELYNPYDTPILLSNANGSIIELQVKDSAEEVKARLGLLGTIPAGKYLVITNAAGTLAAELQALLGPGSSLPGEVVDVTDPGRVTVIEPLDLPAGDMNPGCSIRLVQRQALAVGPAGLEVRDPEMEIDRLAPLMGAWENADGTYGPNGDRWAQRPDLSLRENPDDKNDRFIWDSSLQRRKEPNPARPVHWHFTLSRQMTFPLPYDENDTNEHGALLIAGVPNIVRTRPTDRPPQHNLMGSIPVYPGTSAPFGHQVYLDGQNRALISNQELLAWESDGRSIYLRRPGSVTVPVEHFPLINVPANRGPLASCPVLVADAGVDARSGGALAFPTTGTLLLVSRYAHERRQDLAGTANEWLPATVAATRNPSDKTSGMVTEAMLRLDNGHLPVFDTHQRCLDNSGGKGRPDVPWGQMVFNYFTALPLEELYYFGNREDPQYEQQYAGAGVYNNPIFTNLPLPAFPYYPLVERVSQAPSPFGPKVRGRINLNFAPWWVLDGLPVLPDAIRGTAAAAVGDGATTQALPAGGEALPVAGVPVREILSGRLDPAGANPDNRPGQHLVRAVMDDQVLPVPNNQVFRTAGLPTIGPALAKHIVARREIRPVDGYGTSAENPGLLTVGTLCEVVAEVRLPGTYTIGLTQVTNPTLPGLRTAYDSQTYNTPELATIAPRPYSYLGYLQLVTPVVRLQDWATVKNHAYTVYTVVGDTADPPVWLRTQTTVDRTRCLYSNELPDRVVVTEPVGYYNAVSDQ